MNAKVFDINNFNIISDNDNYYFIRALNMGDNNDIESNITTDSSGNIIKVRTDRERYTKEAKYDINSEISLEEIYDHIKMQHRTDTNCISLSSNCNVSLMYGRGYYKDRYILVKVPKDKLGQIVINAPEYMINEINKRIDEYINNGDLRDEDIYKLKTIDSIDSREELDIFINNNLKEDYIDSDFEEGITYRYDNTTTVDYQALNKEQNLLKNKIVAKLNIISNDIILNVSNKNLIKALGNAVSSLELIHYNDIDKESIIEVPKEIIDILALIQQLPKDNVYASDLKQEVLNYLNTNNNIEEFKYHNNNINSDNEYTISDMYELTNGNVSYYDAINIYKKSYYLAKSKLRTIDMINELNIITNNNPKYYETLNYLITHTYGIEPDIFSRQNTNRFVVSESVSLDFAYNEEELFNYINNLPNNDLETILNNPKSSLQTLINNMSFINKDNIFKEDYYANAIIDMFDWQSIGVKDFSYKHRLNLINKLKENKVVEIYDVLKSHNISEKRISNILLTNIIKGKDIADIDFKDTFTTRDLDEFLGYYKVKGTNNLVLRDYQASAHNNNNKIFEEKQFVADIVPTGGGKSFIALAQMLHNIDNYPNRSKKILYLAPNDVILEQIKDYIIENIAGDTVSKTREEKIKEVFPNLKLATYQSLTSFKEQASNNNHDIINDNYDLIILDELHRTGASEWSKYILELLNNQDKDTKVLGLTATPTRDMDSIDMAEEWARYFGYTEDEIKKHKHLGINMDLEYAIKLGYVMNPKIVECIYSLQEKDGFIDNLNEQINTITDIEVKNNYIRKLDKLRRKVSEAEGVEKILQSNIKRGEKYIIFCPVINKGETIESEDGYEVSGRITGDEAINNIIEEITNKLSGYINKEDIEFHKMLGTYGKAFNNNQLNKFNADTNPDKVKFMVVINKLNEGAHLKDVKGIIWYRPLDENSKILFLQQLGRIIYGLDPNKELSDDERTIAIDLVCNRLRVNLKDKLKTSDLDYINIIKDWSIAHDNKIPDINSLDKIERNYAKTLRRIKNKYLDYINDPSLIDKTLRKEETFEILKIGTELDIWSYDFPDIINDKNNTNSKEDEDIFNITGVLDDFYELQEEINYVTNLSTKQKIAEYIEKLNNGYKPKYFDDKEKFSDGTPVNQFWGTNKDKIKEELENNSKYKEGYDKAREMITPKIIDKISEIIELMNKGSIPSAKNKELLFSDGSYVCFFWARKHNRDKIKIELDTNKKYEVGYKTAKKIMKDKINEQLIREKLNSDLSSEQKIAEYIEKLNNGYKPKYFDDKEKFSDGTPVNQFWYNHKKQLKNKIDSNIKYRNGYEVAKKIINKKYGELLNKRDGLSNEEKLSEYIEMVNNEIIIKIKSLDKEHKFSDGSFINEFWRRYKNEIKEELENNPKYNEGYNIAKQLLLKNVDKIAEFIEKINNGYKPKYFDDKEKFSDGTPVNQFWRSHRRKIKEELENNSKYKEGYDKAKQVLVEKNDKYLIKIHEFIEKMNNGYIPIVDDKKEKFSDGTPVNQFWKINKDKIKEELENNSKYQGSHDKAKQILFFKTVEKIDKHSIRINEFINKINNGYIPKKFDDKEVFSDGTPLNYFWYSNKDRIKEELDNNSKYRVGYNRAKEIFNMYINKDKKKENKELIKELCKEYNIDIKINKDIFNIPYSEVYVKLCYLIQYELPIVDNDGNINNIFYMSDINMQAHYNISLDELINKYIEARKMK